MSTGILLLIDEANRSDHLLKHIDKSGRFSDALSMPDWALDERSMALIGFAPSHFHYAALARRGRRVATFKFQVEFTDFVDLGPLALEELESELRSSLRPHFTRVSSGQGQPVPRQIWSNILAAIRQLRPSLVSDLDRLEELAATRIHAPLDARQQQLAQEKDALLLARQIFGLDSRRDPLRWSRSAREAEIPSFLAAVNASGVFEDSLVQHDREYFGAWQLIRRFQVGAVQFARGKELLTVVTANNNPLEHSLGVDLIYWHHQYDSFTMVQYKRMVGEGRRKKRVAYRPSGSYEEEIRRMQAIWARVGPSRSQLPGSLCSGYRLNSMPFFFKLCQLSEFDPEDQGLVPGMYIPLDYWEILLASDDVTGPRGGKVLTYENVGRHLNNTEFIPLVQSGWIGSSGLASAQLEELITYVLSSGRAVNLAWSSPDEEG